MQGQESALEKYRKQCFLHDRTSGMPRTSCPGRNNTIGLLLPSPVILGGKPKWLPLKFGYDYVMRTVSVSAFSTRPPLHTMPWFGQESIKKRKIARDYRIRTLSLHFMAGLQKICWRSTKNGDR